MGRGEAGRTESRGRVVLFVLVTMMPSLVAQGDGLLAPLVATSPAGKRLVICPGDPLAGRIPDRIKACSGESNSVGLGWPSDRSLKGISLWPATGEHQQAGSSQGNQPVSLIEDVSPQDVKKFIDPTVMNSVLEYRFQANFLPQQVNLFTHRPYIGHSLNYWSAVWAEVPVHDFSVPDGGGPAGIGDMLIGWGVVPYKNLSSRFSGVAFWVEGLAPTGDRSKGTGFDTWVLAPAAGVALNPTDQFPVYISGRYLHSLGELDGIINGEPTRVRSIELSIETLHIFPKGFFVAALPSFTFNLNQNFNLFSLGVGVGRALNRRLLVNGGYVHYIAGERTFNQAFVLGLSFIWGKEKAKP